MPNDHACRPRTLIASESTTVPAEHFAPHATGLLAGLLAATIALTVAAPALAATGPIGPEYAIGDRAVPARGWWQECTFADGRSVRAEAHCTGDEGSCRNLGDIRIQMYSATGKPTGKAVDANVGRPAWLRSQRLACHPDGRFVVSFRDAAGAAGRTCWLHRTWDVDDGPQGEPQRSVTNADRCSTRPNLAMDGDGSFVAAWPEMQVNSRSNIVAQRYDATGAAAGEPAIVETATAGWDRQMKLAVDGAGNMLVAWRLRPGENEPWEIRARAYDATLAPLAEAWRVDTYDYGTDDDPTVTAPGEGLFEVAWTNDVQGGRVARQVALDGAESPVRAGAGARAAVVAAFSRPRFGAARILDNPPDAGAAGIRTLAGDGQGGWMAANERGEVLHSERDGLGWSLAEESLRQVGVDVAMAISDSVDGTCIGIGRDDRHPVVYAARSTDGCRSFDSVHALADLRANRGNCNDCVLPQAVVRSLGAGRWIAAWTASGQVTTGDSVDGVYVARSSDDGRTWTIAGGDKPKPVFSDYAPSGLDLEAGDSAGSAVMAFAGEDLFVARTGNGGSSWSSATRVAEGMGCLDCNSLRFFNRIDLARGTDRLLLAFASHRWRTEEFGNDGDVFVAASTNGGGSWSDPEPIAGWAATDGSRDAEPTIATDGDGRWVATWYSHHRVDGGDELAPDVVVAVSEDGQHWDAPTKVAGVIAADADEASPTFQDGPRLAWDARGVGMLTWTSTKLGVGGDSWARRVYAAVADASCGDGNVDVGEDCDDGGHSGDCYDDCTLPGCGNGHLDDGELCDDGDARDDNGCSTLCLAPYCGDGIVSPGEDCDDANDIDTDACTNTCREARCGDGVVWEGEEVCDPADPADDGWCVRDCTRGFCGDGIVSPAFELCDDGNDEDGDRCPSDCSEAWCGDGYTAPGVEECDPFDSRFGGVCTYDCKLATVCGDANGDEKISAGDALRVLQRGVDLPMDCPELACDIDANGTISATDAAMDLAMAVGRNVEGHCTLGTGWIVFSTEDPREIGSLQLTINYSATGGTFVNDRDGKAVCEGLAGGEYAYNNQPDLGTLDMAMITLDPLSGPVDIFRCLFELEGPAREAPLALAVTDASTPDANPLEPFPLLTFRLE